MKDEALEEGDYLVRAFEEIVIQGDQFEKLYRKGNLSDAGLSAFKRASRVGDSDGSAAEGNHLLGQV